MKSVRLFLVVVFCSLFQSCSKDSDVAIDNFSIEEAKVSFVNDYEQALSTKGGDSFYYSLSGGDYTPMWDLAISNENEYIWSLEVPIVSDMAVVVKNKRTDNITRAERRLLFIKNKDTKSVYSYMMVSEAPQTKTSDSGYAHLSDNSSYTGMVLFSTLSGDFVSLNRYSNGVSVASVNASETSHSHHHQCDSTGCDGHIHTDAIDDVLGDDEYGVMPLGMGGQYYEGYCIWCGAPYPYCYCISSPCDKCGHKPCICVCKYCGYDPCICLNSPCEICGVYPCICLGSICEVCDSDPCICDEFICKICGKHTSECTCNKTVCDRCGKLLEFCNCDIDNNEEIWCNTCGNYHLPNECKYICPFCGKYLDSCVCK